jgi:hypothetical protein
MAEAALIEPVALTLPFTSNLNPASVVVPIRRLPLPNKRIFSVLDVVPFAVVSKAK